MVALYDYDPRESSPNIDVEVPLCTTPSLPPLPGTYTGRATQPGTREPGGQEAGHKPGDTLRALVATDIGLPWTRTL